MKREKTLIGQTAKATFVSVVEKNRNIPAKIDTGAMSSSVWASNIAINPQGVLSFTLFAEGSPHYTGKVHETKLFNAKIIRSSNGTAQVRYSVMLSVILGGRRIRGTFTLADRSKNTFPVLIGCRLLNRKFIVDVSKGAPKKQPPSHNGDIDAELQRDPYAFYLKYHAANERGDLEL